MEDIKMDQYMSSTTKIPFHSGKEYHVFLSFRGKDVRNTLVHQLYEALTAAGLDVFLDSEKLKKGEIIEESLERALKSSAIRIPIFSQGYASSAWCLREAADMLRSPGKIIPLFYDVDPTNVRYPLKESSPYKEAFEKHYGHSDRYSREEVKGWQDALQQICSRSGWSRDLTGGSEAQLIKTVVNDLIKTFDRVQLQVAKHPVGMDSLTHHLIHKFQLNSEGGVIKAGLWGIGGIGKTTLAKALNNQISSKFDAASFVFNVRATAAEGRDLIKLQKQILKDLISYDGEVNSVEYGISLFKHRLGGKRVLLILDDMDGRDQSEALVGDWLASGSRVIITSRDRHILHLAGVSSEFIHEMSGLEINESLQLFSWHAFLRASPTPTHKDLSERIVDACKGHPLSLEIIGSFLYDKQDDPDCWTEALHDITLHPGIQERLEISYSEEEKKIFLDIACFFIGENKTCPIVFWKSLYRRVHAAVNNLSLKLLMKIDEEGVFDMHDHLRDMGRSIAEREREREGTRLWDAVHLNRGVSNNNNFFRGIRLDGGNSQGIETLCGPGLRLLHLKDVPIARITQAMLPPSLIWLRLRRCQKPSHFSLNIWRFAIQRLFHFRLVDNIWDLRILQIDGNISNLQYSLSYILGNLSQLEHLELSHCSKLNKLPRTIGNLSKLQSLDLRCCGKLKKLPRTIGNLSKLQHLDLGECTNLNNLLDAIGNLSQLQHLDLRLCTNLNNLPDAIGNLSQLQYLNLKFCTNLNNLPDAIGNLSQLQHLGLIGCTNLNNLPDAIGNLSQLQHLYLGRCTNLNLNNLSDVIGNLSQLQRLYLGGCTNLNNLPDAIGNLSQLQHLYLAGCTNLNYLPDAIGNLSQLQHLDLGKCTNLNNLPDAIGNLSQLQHLQLGWCTNLNNLPDAIGNLSQLQDLYLTGCTNLNNLPDAIGNLSQLQSLSLRECTNLNNLPVVSQLREFGLLIIE